MLRGPASCWPQSLAYTLAWSHCRPASALEHKLAVAGVPLAQAAVTPPLSSPLLARSQTAALNQGLEGVADATSLDLSKEGEFLTRS